MALETLRDLFLNELRDMYHAEKQLVRALPRMAKAADSDELRQAIQKHHGETEGQVRRLERVFQSLGETARAKRCQGMQGIVEEGKEILEEDGQEPVIDAAIIAAAQKVEHYEIASYGCLITYADLLGEREASKLLKQTLAEEEATDKALTQLAERSINQAAAAVGAESEEE
ncbi:MAG: ferritin-like domain-containing protein [Gemmatimonadales bacterium]|jgi:ferritin-like metal-binding protein YciE